MTIGGEVSGPVAQTGGQSANLADILERVLDRGLVIAGDIRVNLLDIELLTIKLRLVIASLDTAQQVGMDWWRNDPWFTGDEHQLRGENEQLRARIAELEQHVNNDRKITSGEGDKTRDKASHDD